MSLTCYVFDIIVRKSI